MKIAFVVHEYNRHIGHARYVAELASRYKINHEVHVFTSVWEEPDPAGITFHYVPAWRWKTLTSVLTSIIPSTFMVGRDFDIIHSQGLCGFRHDLSTAHFIQNKWLKSLKSYGKSLGWSTLAWKWMVAPLEKLSLGTFFCDRVIAISERIRKDLASEYGRTANVDLVYHGVDLQRFHPGNKTTHRDLVRKNLGISGEEFVALFVGNLQKGAGAAIEAVSKVPNIRLVLVSGSSNEMEKELVCRLGMEGRVTWVPLSREVEKYFACADCFVFPTLYEPFGMVISEAMASGIPVITNKSAGASELIDNGISGLLTDDPWGVDEIASCLKKLVENPEIRQTMGLAARKAVELFTWDRCANQTMEVYHKVLESKKNTKRE